MVHLLLNSTTPLKTNKYGVIVSKTNRFTALDNLFMTFPKNSTGIVSNCAHDFKMTIESIMQPALLGRSWMLRKFSSAPKFSKYISGFYNVDRLTLGQHLSEQWGNVGPLTKRDNLQTRVCIHPFHLGSCSNRFVHVITHWRPNQTLNGALTVKWT